MPQEHHVLKCFSCETFQVHIVKKIKKWECKVCGAKQSVKRNFGRGSGKDCRKQVMKLNELRLANSLNLNAAEDDSFENQDLQLDFASDISRQQQFKDNFKKEKTFTSKWADYLEEPISDDQDETQKSTLEFFMEKENKKKRVRKMPDCSNINKKVCKESNIEELSQIHKEADDFILTLRSLPNIEKAKIQEKDESIRANVEGTCQNQVKKESKFSKYTKFLDEQEENKNDVKKINTCSSIFDSDLNDLDDILSFE